MCTVSWLHDEIGGYQILCNRDEKYTRGRASAPRIETRNGMRYLAPIDSDSGGTWILTNELGITLCLLNGTDNASYWSAKPRPVAAPSCGCALDPSPDEHGCRSGLVSVRPIHALVSRGRRRIRRRRMEWFRKVGDSRSASADAAGFVGVCHGRGPHQPTKRVRAGRGGCRRAKRGRAPRVSRKPWMPTECVLALHASAGRIHCQLQLGSDFRGEHRVFLYSRSTLPSES